MRSATRGRIHQKPNSQSTLRVHCLFLLFDVRVHVGVPAEHRRGAPRQELLHSGESLGLGGELLDMVSGAAEVSAGQSPAPYIDIRERRREVAVRERLRDPDSTRGASPPSRTSAIRSPDMLAPDELDPGPTAEPEVLSPPLPITVERKVLWAELAAVLCLAVLPHLTHALIYYLSADFPIWASASTCSPSPSALCRSPCPSFTFSGAAANLCGLRAPAPALVARRREAFSCSSRPG